MNFKALAGDCARALGGQIKMAEIGTGLFDPMHVHSHTRLSYRGCPYLKTIVASMPQNMAMHARSLMSVQHGPQHSHASQQVPRAFRHTPFTPMTHARVNWRSFGPPAPLAQSCTRAHHCRAAHSSPPSSRDRHQKGATTTAASATQSSVGTDSPAAAAAALYSWLAAERGLPAQGTSPQSFQEGAQAVLGFAASR